MSDYRRTVHCMVRLGDNRNIHLVQRACFCQIAFVISFILLLTWTTPREQIRCFIYNFFFYPCRNNFHLKDDLPCLKFSSSFFRIIKSFPPSTNCIKIIMNVNKADVLYQLSGSLPNRKSTILFFFSVVLCNRHKCRKFGLPVSITVI